MNELTLYEIIRAILTNSSVMEGRFIVAPGYGTDLNTNNLGDVVKDALEAYKPIDVKYPVCVLLPPIEVIDSVQKGWSRFRMEQFFLCRKNYTGDGQFKQLNPPTNTDEHTIEQDWKDMREAALDFRKKMNDSIRENNYQRFIHTASDLKEIIRRVSNMGNDRLNGVQLSYELRVAFPCEVADYTESPITLPTITNTHPIHQH